MRYLLIPLLLCTVLCLSAQEVTTFQDEIPVNNSKTLTILLDSTNVQIKYWDADYIYVETELAYEESARVKVFETPPVYVFGIEGKKEDGKIYVEEKKIENSDQHYGPTGQFHTFYLPNTIETVEWVINIPSSL